MALALLAGCTTFGSSGGTDPDGGGADASADAPGDAAPAVYDVPCAGDTRCTGFELCCGTGTPSCVPQAMCTGQYSYSCNDAEDCRARGLGGICCGYRQDQNMLVTVCRKACTGTEEHLCEIRASADECGATGKTCTRYPIDLNIAGFASCR